MLCGCAHSRTPAESVDFSLYKDGPLPPEAALWLAPGGQSGITPGIAAEAALITGQTRRERLFKGMAYVWRRFAYDRGFNDKMFSRDSNELFTSNVLGGCSDFALAEAVFFRALGIPARLVITANIDWIEAYRFNEFSMTTGHTFVEVFLEDRWHLLDSTFRFLHSGYDPSSPFYPRKEFFCGRGADFWGLGIRDVDQLNVVMKECIRKYADGSYREPVYDKEDI